MAAEFTRLTHKRETTASSGGELYHLQFSLQATSSETFGYTPPIQWAPGALSLGLKRPGCEADHSPPSSAEVEE